MEVALAISLLSVPIAASAQMDQVSELLAIRASASAAAATSRRLASEGGADFQTRAMETIRRSCASRGVTRLDEVAPSSVSSEASEVAAKALLELKSVANTDHAAFAMEAVDQNSQIELTQRGLLLKNGQARTTQTFAIARDDIGTIEIDVATSGPSHLLLGWNESADAPRLRRNNARIELVGDGRVHTYSVDAAAALARGLSSGEFVRRFFLATRGDAPLDVRALRVLSRAHRYVGRAYGTTHEFRAGQWRSVLYLRPPTTLTFDVSVPGQSPVLETGLAALTSSGVLEFEIAVEHDDARTVLLKRLVRHLPTEDAWEEIAADLTPWAGKNVRISLGVRGTDSAVALWSSPLVRPRLGAEETEPILVVLEDALRADRLSVYGGPVATPAHQSIADSGVVFERAFAQATQTRSSVPSMMTSVLPSANGTWDFSDALSDRYVTLAEALRACGFATASFIQNGNAGPYAGLAQGFDVVFSEDRFGPHAADLLSPTSAVDEWIAGQTGRPWFAYVHVLDPHGPYDPPNGAKRGKEAKDDQEELARDKAIDAGWVKKPTAETRRELYDAEIAANDLALANFLQRFSERGDLQRAIVAIVADHGEFLGEHGGLWRHHPPGHVEVARVPFLLRTPDSTANRIAEPVGLLDLMPTLLELAGADASALPMHGSSLVGTLRGGRPPARAIVSEEMLLERGERGARGCGSFATPEALWLLPCTEDDDFTPGRMLAHRSGKRGTLRRFSLQSSPIGTETPLGQITGPILDALVAGALRSAQSAGLDAWQAMSDLAPQPIVSEPETSERLRALGYLE